MEPVVASTSSHQELKATREPAENMADPRVCVIIPTLRNAEELEIALDGLSKQTWVGPLEVVIVGPTGDPGQDIAM